MDIDIDHEMRRLIEIRYASASDILFTKDPDTTYIHSLRVATLAALFCDFLGNYFGLPRDLVFKAFFLHDIGKIGMPDEILCGTERYDVSSAEFEIIKRHTVLGRDMVRDLHDIVINIVLCHQEKFDGTGYPQRLIGEIIPLEARMAGLIDAFDAMCTERPYKEPRKLYDVLKEIEGEAGKHFDPYLAERFVEMLRSGDRKIESEIEKFYSSSLILNHINQNQN